MMDMNIVIKQERDFDEICDNGVEAVETMHSGDNQTRFCITEEEEESQSRFANISDEQIVEILSCKDNVNTQRSTRAAVTVLSDYCIKKKKSTVFPDYTKPQLASLLRRFYVEARKRDGQLYKRSALNAIRYGINRYFQETLKMKFDIIKDSDFLETNRVFKAQMFELNLQGKGTTHNPQLTLEDMKKIYTHFAANLDKPHGLQEKVFFDIMYHLSRGKECGRENLREMTVSTFTISTGKQGRRFVHRASHLEQWNLEELETRENRMYETIGNALCAVKTFETYLSKLNPSCEFLWQRPRDSKCMPLLECWYANSPVGHNTLGSMTKIICRSSGVSLRYTNQSIRATPMYPIDMYFPVKIPVIAWSSVPISLLSADTAASLPPAQSVLSRSDSSVVPQTVTAIVSSTAATSVHAAEPPRPPQLFSRDPVFEIKQENHFSAHTGDIVKDYGRCSWYPVLFKRSDFSKFESVFTLTNRGKQGLAYNMMCLVYNEMKYIGGWNAFDLNNILFLADELYCLIKSYVGHGQYKLTDFPTFTEVFDNLYSITVGDNKYYTIDSNDLDPVFSEILFQNKYVILSYKEFTFSLIKCDRCPGIFICDSESKSFAVLCEERKEVLQKSKTLHIPDVETFICFLKLLAKCSLQFKEADDGFTLNAVSVVSTSTSDFTKYSEAYSALKEQNRLKSPRVHSNKITHPDNRIVLRGDYLMADRGDGLNALLGGLFFHHMKSILEWSPADLMGIESSILSVINSWESGVSCSHWERLTSSQHYPKYLRLNTPHKEYRLGLTPKEVDDNTWLHKDQEFQNNVAFLYSFGAAVIKDNDVYHVILEQLEMWNIKSDLTVITVNTLQHITTLLKWKGGNRRNTTLLQMQEGDHEKLFHVMQGTVSTLERDLLLLKDHSLNTIPFTSNVLRLTEKQ